MYLNNNSDWFIQSLVFNRYQGIINSKQIGAHNCQFKNVNAYEKFLPIKNTSVFSAPTIAKTILQVYSTNFYVTDCTCTPIPLALDTAESKNGVFSRGGNEYEKIGIIRVSSTQIITTSCISHKLVGHDCDVISVPQSNYRLHTIEKKYCLKP